jgi:hypothetical protein
MRENDHTYYHFKYKGRDVCVSTMISHGEKGIGIGLVKRMRAQMRLATNVNFARLVERPQTLAEYMAILRAQHVIADE